MSKKVYLDELVTPQRYSYSAEKAPYPQCWPNGKGLAVYIAMNLEHFAFDTQEGAKLSTHANYPDVLNYSWRDYGNRVGAWHLAELFDSLSIPPAVIANTAILDYCPQLLDRWLAIPGSELIAHGHTNSQRQGELEEDDESLLIATCQQRLNHYLKKEVKGWLSPWISESFSTPELLVKHQFSYTLNWAHDDIPTLFNTENGPLIAIPYPQEINDIPTIIPNGASIETFCQMVHDQFEELLSRSQHTPQVMGIALHPYIVGQPFRFHRLKKVLHTILDRRNEYWLTTPGEIAALYEDQ
ncbi:polysaccharide deacetylase [Rosenbergiella australiborealis]|uniref:polysaccharide deacetylase n=2 Tax=Rosenbergiella australiborealis TaxID=1544696 RepID=UPI001F4E6136|nr:polysaccharide deacetylase [Rosenbergiella australiborealis]